ncbi:hypothetical protein GCM10027160_24140 [Streptomyces calidiresistens]|uniref:Uncharacterized protein n=1 Tax=Streptomyces calidiresistens TaxID=1485586 RepID=A0A7W3XXB6_9ACTN|nr:hypothetical protein [Streptomyces calidiresistens]MBB0230632.1 hypothetical protein [Streptomyces calidiresistens]
MIEVAAFVLLVVVATTAVTGAQWRSRRVGREAARRRHPAGRALPTTAPSSPFSFSASAPGVRVPGPRTHKDG